MVGFYDSSDKKKADHVRSLEAVATSVLGPHFDELRRSVVESTEQITGKKYLLASERATATGNGVPDIKTMANTLKLRHGVSNVYIEKPFEELEDEIKTEGGEIELPANIYTVAMCAGFFCDQSVFEAMQARIDSVAKKVSGGVKPSKAEGETEPAFESTSTGDTSDSKMSCGDMLFGMLKNWWLMLVNAFVLLFFHYFLTFTVLWYMYNHPYESDPLPYDEDWQKQTTENGTWSYELRWDAHFVQGDCSGTDFVLRGICASLFACFVYFDIVQSFEMVQWLYWVPLNKTGTSAQQSSIFFPDELKVRIIPSPFGARGDESDREIQSRVPPLFRVFLFWIVIIPKVAIAMMLLFFGGKLVLRSENNPDVIMNSLAAYFVAEMDEYVYQYLCPPAIQSVLEDPDRFPPVRKKTAEVDTVRDPELEAKRTEMRKEALKEAVADFKKFDDNDDGVLSEYELGQLFKALGFSVTTPEIRQILLFCDKNGDGFVSLKELEWLLSEPPNTITEQPKFNDPPDIRTWLQKEFIPVRATAPLSLRTLSCLTHVVPALLL